MTDLQSKQIRSIYRYLLYNNPERLEYLAQVYSDQSGISRDVVSGLDAIINFIVFNKYSIDQILKFKL